MQMNEKESESSEGFGWKAILRFVIYLLLMPMVLFIAAGTLHWTMGWVYVILSLGFTAVSRILVFRTNPDMLKERARSLDAENVKRWDKILLVFAAILGPLTIFVVAGLDVRFSWSQDISIAIRLLALLGVIIGYMIGGWAMVANKFFSAMVRIQKERHQFTVSDGPYKIVRHPGYAGGILTLLSTPLMLGSLWAILPAVLVMCLVIVRTYLEDKTLQEELEGYKEYSTKVRFRLLPGIW